MEAVSLHCISVDWLLYDTSVLEQHFPVSNGKGFSRYKVLL